MSTSKQRRFKDSEKGQATFEAVPLLLVFVLFVGYGMGAFGIVHTGILQSISSRTYAFETFRHRHNVTYFRENNGATQHYRDIGIRLHAIKSETGSDGTLYSYASERQITFAFSGDTVGRTRQKHQQTVDTIQSARRASANTSVNPAWIRVQYGICINASCGDNSGGEG